MSVKSLRTGVAAAMGGAVLLACLIVGASIALADDADTDVPDATSGEAVERCHDFFRDRAHMFGGSLEDIATELETTLEDLREQLADGATLEDIATKAGIDLDAVLAELRDGALAAVDERVAAGTLTEEQGDAIKERIESFDPGTMRFGGHRFDGRMPEGFDFGRGFGDLRGLFGDLDLDIDLSELRELLESGTSPEEALAELGIDLDTVIADAQASVLTHLDELVADGTLSQERADQIKEMIEGFDLSEGLPFDPRGFGFNFEDFDFEGFDFEGFDFDGFGFDRFHGPHGHGFFGGDDNTNAEGAGFSA